MVHADFANAEGSITRQTCEGKGNPPMIVVGRYGGVRPAIGAQAQAQHVLGSGFAHTARYGHNLACKPCAGSQCQLL